MLLTHPPILPLPSFLPSSLPPFLSRHPAPLFQANRPEKVPRWCDYPPLPPALCLGSRYRGRGRGWDGTLSWVELGWPWPGCDGRNALGGWRHPSIQLASWLGGRERERERERRALSGRKEGLVRTCRLVRGFNLFPAVRRGLRRVRLGWYVWRYV
jgi:hypothetical protein